MNKAQAHLYLASGGVSCPYCGGKIFNDMFADIIDDFDEPRVCGDCKKKWTDHYTLTGVDEHKKGENDE